MAAAINRRSILRGDMGAATALVRCRSGEATPRTEVARAEECPTAPLHAFGR